MTDWNAVRALFDLDPHRINLTGMSMASHVAPVRKAIRRHRRLLNRDPYPYLAATLHHAEDEVCDAVHRYFGVAPGNVALTNGTTQGLALMYAGVTIPQDMEIVASLHEFSGALACLESRSRRSAIPLHLVPLYSVDPATITTKDIIDSLAAVVNERTRVLALTWVYSSTGLKLPIAEIAEWLSKTHGGREPSRQVLLCVDGVHGFGAEQITFDQLKCDFLVSGCHKWTHGPRGTGIWCGRDLAWTQCEVIEPTSSRTDAGLGRKMSPGGVQDYEHRWSLKECFDFLRRIGKPEITARIQTLAKQAKSALSGMNGVRVVTPMAKALSSGIVCFDVGDRPASEIVARLAAAGVIASQSSGDRGSKQRHVRLSFSIFNTDDDLAAALDAIRALTVPRTVTATRSS